MSKDELSVALAEWLRSYLEQRNDLYVLDVLIPESNLSKLNIDSIKALNGYSTWEFKPDVLGIVKIIETDEVKLVLINRSTSALSLREIGEIRLYSQLVGPELSFLVSLNGVSGDVAVLLIENEISGRLLKFGNDKEIIIFTWSNGVKIDSVLPLSARTYFS